MNVKNRKPRGPDKKPRANKWLPDYDPKFDQMLIEHMSQGYSFESFGSKAGCGSEHLHEWARNNETFRRAKHFATEKCREFWEEIGIMRSKKMGIAPGDSRTYLLNMRNRFGWQTSDTTIQIQNPAQAPIIVNNNLDLTKATNEQLEQEINSRLKEE